MIGSSRCPSKIYGTIVTLKVYLQSQICRILRDQSGTRVERDRDKLAKILKVSQLLARPRGFEPLTLGLEN